MSIDDLASPGFYINHDDTAALAEALRAKGYDLPLVAVAALHEVWSEENYSAGWLQMGSAAARAKELLEWIKYREA